MNQNLIEKSWEQREDVIYKSLFPNMPNGIFTPKPGQTRLGENELLLSSAGVFEISPSENNPYWAYITSGLSNPFDDNCEISGYGFELLIKSKVQMNNYIPILWNLMGYVFSTGKTFAHSHRMSINSPVDGENSKLNTLLFYNSEKNKKDYILPTGKFQILCITAITPEEYQYAKDNTSEKLIDLLKENNFLEIIDPSRGSLV